jgi:S1-C subfamily serine protease
LLLSLRVVTLTDGRVYSCDVTGTDDIVDIAVLKIIIPDDGPLISNLNLPVAELGDSDQLKVGKIVVAVGSPGGLDNTVTMGIVSGRERSSMMVGVPHKLVNYIQTDAAINPGNSGKFFLRFSCVEYVYSIRLSNSNLKLKTMILCLYICFFTQGGPLIDVESGQVIGINAAIRAHMEGTSFAIPINRVRDIMHDLSEGKEIRHGYLGCQLTTCTPDWARENNVDSSSKSADRIPEVYGALVHKIYRKTSTHLGGLKEHDIIQRIGSETVRSASDASRLIDLATPGKS